MRTEFARNEDYKDSREWYHVDASGKVLGRMAARIAMALMGKDHPEYTPNVDTGAFVVVTNAEKIVLTGNKRQTKTYGHWSGYPGGYKETKVETLLQKHPDRVVREAVRRMLPKNALGDDMLKKLKVYAGPKHPHTYHKPQPLEV